MKNFWRALQFALRQRFRLAASLICATFVALMWGGNIAAVYPLVEVILRGESIPEWVDGRIAYGEGVKAAYERQVARLERLLAMKSPERRHPTLEAEIQSLERSKPLSADRSAVREAAKELKKLKRLAATHSPEAQQRLLEDERVEALDRVQAEAKDLDRVRRVQRYAHAYLPTDSFDTLLLIVALLMVSTLLKALLLLFGTILVARLAQLATLDLRARFFHHTLHGDMAGTHAQARSDLMNRFTSDMGSVSGGIQILFGRAVREPLKMIVCLVFAAYCCWRLLLLTMLVAPPAAYLIGWLAKSLKRVNRRAMEEMSHVYNAMSEILSCIKVVKAFTGEAYEEERFRATAREYDRRAMKIARYDSLISPLNEVLGISMICVAVLVSGYLSLNHETHLFGIKISDTRLTTGVCITFYMLLAGMIDPSRKLSDVFGRIQKACAASDRVFEVLDRQPRIQDPPHPRLLARHHRELALEGVSFGYQPERLVLEDIDLRMAFGETIAIVGPNGCGKSTLASLLLRFFDPGKGSVKLDGIDLRDVRQQDLRQQIGLVTQETLLFDDTVLANIHYGSPGATREEVVHAAKQAHAHQFIETKLSDGYDTLVGPGGNRLSGGQRQRIALARAILRDPAILILDEATSQIDLESERLIHQALEQFTHNRTTVLITHRLSALGLAGRIVVMDHGRILDAGTHQELTMRCEFYRRLYQIDLQRSA